MKSFHEAIGFWIFDRGLHRKYSVVIKEFLEGKSDELATVIMNDSTRSRIAWYPLVFKEGHYRLASFVVDSHYFRAARCFVYCRGILRLLYEYLPVVLSMEFDCSRSCKVYMYSVTMAYFFVIGLRYFTVVLRAIYFVSLALVSLFYHHVNHF